MANHGSNNVSILLQDSIPPETTIDSQPSDPTNSTAASFTFSANESSTFQCKLDAEIVFASCSSPKSYSDLGEGSHTFEVKAIDQAGNEDPTPASFTWTIDTTPPAAPQITDTDPDSPANDDEPEVKGTAAADADQIALYVDDPSCTDPPAATGSKAAFEGAGITVAVSADQTTQLRARALDQAGNPSPCSDPFAYTEDSTAPAAPQITDTDPDSPANDDEPEVKGTAAADADQIALYVDDPSCTDPPAATAPRPPSRGPGSRSP